MKREEGLQLAAKLKKKLFEQGIPVREVLLFGSVAREEADEESDVDIAVICDPFLPSRLEENVEISKARWNIDLHIETVCLHPEDLENKYSTLGQEVKRYGIPVE